MTSRENDLFANLVPRAFLFEIEAGAWERGGLVAYMPIGDVRYINILTWLRGFRVKNVNFLSFFSLSIPKRDLNTKKITPNIEVCPESLVAMLEYWYIERGLFVIGNIPPSMPSLISWSGLFAVQYGGHFRSGIISGPIWVSFADPYRSSLYPKWLSKLLKVLQVDFCSLSFRSSLYRSRNGNERDATL